MPAARSGAGRRGEGRWRGTRACRARGAAARHPDDQRAVGRAVGGQEVRAGVLEVVVAGEVEDLVGRVGPAAVAAAAAAAAVGTTSVASSGSTSSKMPGGTSNSRSGSSEIAMVGVRSSVSSWSSMTLLSMACRTRRSCCEHDVGVSRTQVALPGRGPSHQRVEVGRDVVDERRRGRHVVVHMLVGDLDRAFAEVRLAAGEHLEQQHAERVDVGASVGDALGHQLRRQVGDGAHQHAARRRRRGRRADRASQAEVGHLDLAAWVDQDVLRLDVAVDDARLVRRGDRLEDLLQQGEGSARRQRRLVADQVAQGMTSGDVLHREEQRAVVVALVVDGHDVRVCQAGPPPGPRGRTAG